MPELQEAGAAELQKVIDVRSIKTSEALLLIVRLPYEQEFVMLTAPGEADKFVMRLRTTLTRVKNKLKVKSQKAIAITLNVVETENLEDHDRLTMCKYKTRSRATEAVSQLIEEIQEKVER